MAVVLHNCKPPRHDAAAALGRAKMNAAIRNFIRDDSGADLIEYALLAGLVALAAVATLTTVGTNITGLYTKISTKVAAITIP
jgi:pilus assembly protein Flp/PilA